MKINDPKGILATLSGGLAGSVTRDWALRRGFEWWAAVLLSMAASTIVSAVVLRIT